MMNPGGRVAQQERVASYPTVEACGRALHAKYEPAIALLVDLGKGGKYTVAQQKGPYSRSWQTQDNRGTSFGVINEASCIAERAGAQSP
jgi:hypothetical protein